MGWDWVLRVLTPFVGPKNMVSGLQTRGNSTFWANHMLVLKILGCQDWFIGLIHCTKVRIVLCVQTWNLLRQQTRHLLCEQCQQPRHLLCQHNEQTSHLTSQWNRRHPRRGFAAPWVLLMKLRCQMACLFMFLHNRCRGCWHCSHKRCLVCWRNRFHVCTHNTYPCTMDHAAEAWIMLQKHDSWCRSMIHGAEAWVMCENQIFQTTIGFVQNVLFPFVLQARDHVFRSHKRC